MIIGGIGFPLRQGFGGTGRRCFFDFENEVIFK